MADFCTDTFRCRWISETTETGEEVVSEVPFDCDSEVNTLYVMKAKADKLSWNTSICASKTGQ